jgi:hypothetical protein
MWTASLEEAADATDHVLDLRVCEGGEERQSEGVVVCVETAWEVVRRVAIPVGGQQMNGVGALAGLDLALCEVLGQLISVVHAEYIGLVAVEGAGDVPLRGYREIDEGVVVVGGDLSSPRYKLV